MERESTALSYSRLKQNINKSMKKRVNIIAAIDENNAIGRRNKLLYNIPEDLKHFKELTKDNIVIMGRRTYEFLPIFPLPGRINIIVSNSLIPGTFKDGDNVFLLRSPEQAVKFAEEHYPEKEIFIIGGGKIYKYFLDNIKPGDKLFLTDIFTTSENPDTWFPEFDREMFMRDSVSEIMTSSSGIKFQYSELTCKKKVFISLPFTGLESTLRKRFEDCLEYVKNNLKDYYPTHQENLLKVANNGSEVGDDYAKTMIKDFELIRRSDAVLFGKGWENSGGCYAEWTVARLFNKELYYM